MAKQKSSSTTILPDGTIQRETEEEKGMVEKTIKNTETSDTVKSEAKQTARKPRATAKKTNAASKPATASKKAEGTATKTTKATRKPRTTAKKTDTKQQSKTTASKKAVATANNEHDNQREANHDMLQRLIAMQEDMAGSMKAMNAKLDDTLKEIRDMKNKNATTSTQTSNPTPATTTTDVDNVGNRLRQWGNRMRERISIPRWLYFALATLLLILLLALALSNPKTAPTTTTVTAQRGSIAVNGNVAVHVYQDRYSTDGANAELSASRPLINISYNDDSDKEDESVVINVPESNVKVGENVEVKNE